MLIGGWQKITLIDYPGMVSTTIFTVGCNLRCPFCHNPELVLPELIKKLSLISAEEFFNYLKERQGLIEGVCITGGEPTLQADLADFLAAIKKLGFKIKLDTNGTQPEKIKTLMSQKLVDYWALDIKEPLERKEIYPEPFKIKEAIELIKNSSLDYEFRTTVYPRLSADDILKIVSEIKPAKRYYLQEFSRKKILDSTLTAEPVLDRKALVEIWQKIKENFEICEIRYNA